MPSTTPQQVLKEEEEEEHEYEYYNYGTEREPRFGEVSYQVAGGGLSNGNAYATVELKDGIYYYCEYGKYDYQASIGNKIVWSDEYRRGEKDPYESRSFDILDEEEEEEEEKYSHFCGFGSHWQGCQCDLDGTVYEAHQYEEATESGGGAVEQ
jgi:hypothetical protein